MSESGPPPLTELCVAKLAHGAPPRVLMAILRRMPEELVLDTLRRMIDLQTLTDDRLASFFSISRRVLLLQGCSHIRNSVLRQIPFRCPEIRCLDLSNCTQVTNTVIQSVLQGCSQLQTLRLDGCRHITDAAFQMDHSPFYPLRACTSLRHLSLARCPQITTDLVLFLVKSCRSLIEINFSKCKRISNDALHALLRSSPHLERLDLSFMDHVSDTTFTTNPSDTSHGFLSISKALTHLNLTQSRITDDALSILSRSCPNLQHLSLASCNEVTDGGVDQLRLCRLTQISLNNCGLLTDRGVFSLVKNCGHSLEVVDLSWCMNITDKSVVELLKKCTALKQLKVVWCELLTDAVVDAIAEHPHADTMSVSIGGCKLMTDGGKERARQSGVQLS